MTDFVVDASVAAKWMFQETLSSESCLLLHAAHRLAAPDFVLIEFANIVWQRTRRGGIPAHEAEEVLSQFEKHFELYFSRDVVHSALRLSIGGGMTVYDALYVALAVNLRQPLVTADRQLHAAADRFSNADVIWLADLPQHLSSDPQ